MDDEPIQFGESYKISGFKAIKPSESSVKNALKTNGPLLIHINASGKPFRFYKSGNYHSTSLQNSNCVNHSALLVGFDQIRRDKFWIVQNR